jgi:nicotinate-nucleotide adenylyltransferase
MNQNCPNNQKKKSEAARKVHVAILGGAFNPITKGHMQIAEYVLNSVDWISEVWLMPCYKHMYDKKMESADHRLSMCNLVSPKIPGVHVFDYEIRKKFAGGTYYLMKELLKEDFIEQQHDLYIIIGQDNANTFSHWVEHEKLAELVPFIIIPRRGIIPDPHARWYFTPPHIRIEAKNPIMEVSATLVRKLLSDKKYDEASKLLDEDVFQYILDNGLYSNE